MGATVTIALVFWLASSYVEYKIIKNVPALKKIFALQLPGLILSICIGLAVGAVLGIPTGVGTALGQLVGLATNEFTYKMFDGGNKALTYTKVKKANATEFYNKNRTLIHEAANTVRLGMKALAAIFLFFMFIIGLPVRLMEFVQRTINRFKKVPA